MKSVHVEARRSQWWVSGVDANGALVWERARWDLSDCMAAWMDIAEYQRNGTEFGDVDFLVSIPDEVWLAIA